MKRLYLAIVLSISLFFILFTLKGVDAGCTGTSYSGDCGSNLGDYCQVTGSSASEGSCWRTDFCSAPFWYCEETFYTCDNDRDASAICNSVGGGGGPVCAGTCGGNCGNRNCSEFNNDMNTCLATPGCGEDFGRCSGTWCTIDCANVGDRGVCIGVGCGWTPSYNSCADSSTCSGGQCQTACGDTASCCNPTVWGDWSPAASCGSVTQSKTNQCGTTITRSLCTECGPHYGNWGSCSGSPATQTRPVTYDCR